MYTLDIRQETIVISTQTIIANLKRTVIVITAL